MVTTGSNSRNRKLTPVRVRVVDDKVDDVGSFRIFIKDSSVFSQARVIDHIYVSDYFSIPTCVGMSVWYKYNKRFGRCQ